MNPAVNPAMNPAMNSVVKAAPDPIRTLARRSATPDDRATLDRLTSRMRIAADREGLVDIGYRTVDSPYGLLLLAATSRGLVRVAFERQDHAAVLQELADRISPRVLRLPARLDVVARELEEYFGGRRQSFDLPVDLRLATGFRREALGVVAAIGPGRTRSYAQVASAAGRPGAARAVGTACRLNPVPLVIPCHRVVRADGAFGDYAGGRDVKRLLLHAEGIALSG